MTQQTHHHVDCGQAADALAGAIAADLRAALSTRPRALLLVSGGRSPIPVFTALASQPLPWQRIDVSLVDERSVPPDHADANARLVRTHLLAGPAMAANWIALMPAEVFAAAGDALTAARNAAAQACADPALAAPAVILLGMGNDGHTASLFPDAPEWPEAQRTAQRYLAVQPASAPHARVSLSLTALLAQRRCYLWAAGADKAATLARLQEGTDPALAAGPVARLLHDPAFLLEVICCD